MSIVRPFKAVRPAPGKAEQIASLPYDVMDRAEAKAMAQGNDLSFLRVVRAEINFPDDVDMYSDQVYAKGREVLDCLIEQGHLVQDQKPAFYIYRQIMEGRVQTGLVACASVDEYLTGKIKRHELTLEAKETDRVKHFSACDANTAPIFLTYRYRQRVEDIILDVIKHNKPIFNFISEDGIGHVGWVIDQPQLIESLVAEFAQLPALYIADGHHRSASAARVGVLRRQAQTDWDPEAEFNYFMAVIFADRDLYVMDYNRVVRDLAGHTPEDFIDLLRRDFIVGPAEQEAIRPSMKGEFGLYLAGSWYRIQAKAGLYASSDPVDCLDVTILQKNILEPILGIGDPRLDQRIDFIGGIRGLEELVEAVDSGEMAAAFALYPTSMAELLAIADAGEIMPPKSTWFEPKLRSGLFVHKLSD